MASVGYTTMHEVYVCLHVHDIALSVILMFLRVQMASFIDRDINKNSQVISDTDRLDSLFDD